MKKVLSVIAFILSVPIFASSFAFGSACKTGEPQDTGDEKQNYVLTISTDKQVYTGEEEILVEIVLENLSGTDIEIAYYSPMAVPDSATGQFPAIEQSPVTTKSIFANGDSMRMTDDLGGCFSVGQHHLKYRAVFYLGWETTETAVEVWSNEIDFAIADEQPA